MICWSRSWSFGGRVAGLNSMLQRSITVGKVELFELCKEDSKLVLKKKKSVAKEIDKKAEILHFTSSESMTGEIDGRVGFVVYGEPLSLSRHRNTRFGVMYNPSAKFQKAFLQLSKSFLPSSPMTGPIEAQFKFFFGRPKSHFGTGKNSLVMKKGKSKWHSSRSDLDNLVKFVLDALNGAAYEDDCQISSISCSKLYVANPDDPPRVEVQFRSLRETDLPSHAF
jgi:Holliday junction resolvase RusA-like endonuclease